MRWLGPRGLSVTGVQVLLSGVFAQYADKRELQAALKAPAILDLSDRDELWFDWLADTGDGFDATFATAALLAREKLELPADGGEAHPTERGRLLVLGGDLAYPAAAPAEYLDRFMGPYRSAICRRSAPAKSARGCCASPATTTGTTASRRSSASSATASRSAVGRPCRSRSYFVVKLPAPLVDPGHRPRPRLLHRHAAARLLPRRSPAPDAARRPDHRRVHQPGWLFGGLHSETAAATRRWRSRTCSASSARSSTRPDSTCRLVVGGDIHHYNRYERTDGRQTRIVCGAGGTFLYPTHHIPDHILWPDEPGVAHYELKARYPDAATSKRLRWRTWLAPFLNPELRGLRRAALSAVRVRSAVLAGGRPRPRLRRDRREGADLRRAQRLALQPDVAGRRRSRLWFGLIAFADCRRWRYAVRVRWPPRPRAALVLTFVIWGAARLLAPLDLPFLRSSCSASVGHLVLPGGLRRRVLVGGGLAGAYRLLRLPVPDAAIRQPPRHPRLLGPPLRGLPQLPADARSTTTAPSPFLPIGVRQVPRRWRYVPPAERSASRPACSCRGPEIVPHLIEPPLRIGP